MFVVFFLWLFPSYDALHPGQILKIILFVFAVVILQPASTTFQYSEYYSRFIHFEWSRAKQVKSKGHLNDNQYYFYVKTFKSQIQWWSSLSIVIDFRISILSALNFLPFFLSSTNFIGSLLFFLFFFSFPISIVRPQIIEKKMFRHWMNLHRRFDRIEVIWDKTISFWMQLNLIKYYDLFFFLRFEMRYTKLNTNYYYHFIRKLFECSSII